MVKGLKLRSSILCCFDIWWKQEGLKGLLTSSPSHSAPVQKVPWLYSPPYQVDRVQFLLSPESKFQLQNNSDKPMTTRRHPILLILQSLPPSAPGCSLPACVQCPWGPVWPAVPFSVRLWVLCSYLSGRRCRLSSGLHSLCSFIRETSPGFLMTQH